jgi:hypothetical protein
MGSCVSKKKNNLGSPEGSVYNVTDFDPKLKSHFKKEEVDIVFKASKIAQSFEPPEILVEKPQEKNMKNHKKVLSQSSSSEEIQAGMKRFLNNEEELVPLQLMYASVVPKKMVQFECDVTNNKKIGGLSTFFFENGLVFVPKVQAAGQEGFFEVNIHGKMQKVWLWMCISETLVFRTSDFHGNGLKLDDFSQVKVKMRIGIKEKFYELSRDVHNEKYYNVDIAIPEFCIGQVIFMDSKPCFIIEKKKTDNCIKILPMEKISQVTSKKTLKPAIPDIAVSFIRKVTNDVIRTGFKLENLIFTKKIEDMPIDSIRARANGKDIKIVSEFLGNYFMVCEIISADVLGIENYQNNSGSKRAFCLTQEGKIELIQHKRFEDKYKMKDSNSATSDYLGHLIYNENEQPFAVITALVGHSMIQIKHIKHLKQFFSDLQSRGQKSEYMIDHLTRQDDGFKSEASTLQTQDFSLNDYSAISRRSIQEADIGEEKVEEGEIEFSMSQSSMYSTLRPVHVEPEEISYMFSRNSLLKYSNKYYKAQKIDLELNPKSCSTFTTTSQGLAIISGTSAQLIRDSEKIDLPNLKHHHMFHSTVFHQDRLFVIGGQNCSAVESLDLSNFYANWKEEIETPVIFQEAAACSDGKNIFVISSGLHDHGKPSAYKFDGRWEFISWQVPEFAGMGMIYFEEMFVLFGGQGKNVRNDCFYIFDRQGCVVSVKEFQMPGVYYNKAIGRSEDIFCIGTDYQYFLEFSNGDFKVVVME